MDGESVSWLQYIPPEKWAVIVFISIACFCFTWAIKLTAKVLCRSSSPRVEHLFSLFAAGTTTVAFWKVPEGSGPMESAAALVVVSAMAWIGAYVIYEYGMKVLSVFTPRLYRVFVNDRRRNEVQPIVERRKDYVSNVEKNSDPKDPEFDAKPSE